MLSTINFSVFLFRKKSPYIIIIYFKKTMGNDELILI